MVRTNHNASNPQTVVNGCDMINVRIWLPLFNISDNANNAFRYVDNDNVMTTNKALSIACDVVPVEWTKKLMISLLHIIHNKEINKDAAQLYCN